MKNKGKKGKIFPFELTEFQRIARRDKKAFLSAKKSRKTAERERLEISSRKLEIQRENFMQKWAQKRTDMVWT